MRHSTWWAAHDSGSAPSYQLSPKEIHTGVQVAASSHSPRRASISRRRIWNACRGPSTAIGADPNVNPLAQSQYFNPKAYRVPGNEAENQYGLQPGVDGPFARVDGLKGTHAMLHGALGRMPAGQLSEPLPGTAPPAGTNIPVGPVGNLADPEAATVPGYGTAPVPEGSTPRLAQAAAPVEDAPPAG